MVSCFELIHPKVSNHTGKVRNVENFPNSCNGIYIPDKHVIINDKHVIGCLHTVHDSNTRKVEVLRGSCSEGKPGGAWGGEPMPRLACKHSIIKCKGTTV